MRKVQSPLIAWRPPDYVTGHVGSPIPVGTRFFASPPTEIGRIISAHCGIRESDDALSSKTPRNVVGLFTLGGILTGGFLGAGFTNGHWLGALIGGVIAGSIVRGIMLRREGKRNDCTFVGERGIALFPTSERRRANPKGSILLFSDAVDLQTALLGRNMGTNYDFRWRDAKGKLLFRLEGGYYGGKNNIDPDSAFHFARAAETAWTTHILPHYRAELLNRGQADFETRRGYLTQQTATVRPGQLEITTAGKPWKNMASELDDVTVFQGHIIIRRKDAVQKQIQSLDGTHGICYLSYGSVTNVSAFLQLLTEVAGLRVVYAD